MLRKISEIFKIVTPLTCKDVQWLMNDGIKTEDGLRYISFTDLSTKIKVVPRRKIRFVGDYLPCEGTLTNMITMGDIHRNVLHTNKHGSSTMKGTEPDRGALKIYRDPILDFKCNLIDFKD